MLTTSKTASAKYHRSFIIIGLLCRNYGEEERTESTGQPVVEVQWAWDWWRHHWCYWSWKKVKTHEQTMNRLNATGSYHNKVFLARVSGPWKRLDDLFSLVGMNHKAPPAQKQTRFVCDSIVKGAWVWPQSWTRRPVSSVGRAPDYCARGRGFKPWPDQHSGSLNNWGERAAFVMITPANG